jgi:tetratricopeptide (TPR) repeat protein
MNLPYMVVPGETPGAGTLVYVTCSESQAVLLTRTLRTVYPAARPPVIPAPQHAQYSHCFRVPESEAAFRARWPQIQLQLLLAASTPAPPKPRRAPKTAPAAPDRPKPAQEPSLPALPTPPPAPLASAQPPDPAPAPAPPDPRVAQLDALLNDEAYPALIAQMDPHDPSPALRGRLGVALARSGRRPEARPHLLFAWDRQVRDRAIALELARAHWQAGDFEHSANAYAALIDDLPEDLDRYDYVALAELIASNELDAGAEQQLALIESIFVYADADDASAHQWADRGLALARCVGDPVRVLHAYQHRLDLLIARRAGQDVATLIEESEHDYWGGLLQDQQRYDLLDEISEYLSDFPVLRAPLIAGYEMLLRTALDQARQADSPLPAFTRDLARSLRSLERQSQILQDYLAYRKTSAREELGTNGDGDEEHGEASRLIGRRIALVGGHDRTREHVRGWLEARGARVDEVAPPNNGRIAEREVQDKVQYSHLIVLIVGYMGHDMSKVVSNLQRRSALQGEVLPVDCRGTSGICRAVLEWASRC